MQLQAIDWVVVAVYGLASLVISIVFTRRASRSLEQYFLSGRKLPWWLLGTSMVATTFSTDTPNLVTDMVRNGGVSLNWLWWAFLITGIADGVLLRQAVEPVRRAERHQFLRAALFGRACCLPARLARDLPRRLLQRHHHGDGHACRHQDCRRPARPRPLRDGGAGSAGHHGLRNHGWPVGCRRDGLLPVRPGDDRLVRRSLLRAFAAERRRLERLDVQSPGSRQAAVAARLL